MDKSNMGKSRIKKVFLIGDSIRIGYQPFVEKNLKDIADVLSPEKNCETSVKILQNLENWIDNQKFDIVHINCGLHDIKVEKGKDVNLVPIENYIENLKKIFEFLKRKSRVVIWATTTEIDENSHNKVKPFYRFQKDIVKYNQASILVAREYEIPVNDLYNFTVDKKDMLKKDGVHFTEKGYELLGEKVASFIKKFIEGF